MRTTWSNPWRSVMHFDGADEHHRSALRSRQQTGMRMTEQRAATRQVGTARNTAARMAAPAQLRAVYDFFTDGCDFRDLAAAQSVLST